MLGSPKIIAKACCWLLVYQLGACSCGCLDENLWYRGALTCLSAFHCDFGFTSHGAEFPQPDNSRSESREAQFAHESYENSHSSHDHSDCECSGRPHFIGNRFASAAVDEWNWLPLEFPATASFYLGIDWYRQNHQAPIETWSLCRFHSLLASPVNATVCRLLI